MYWNWIRIWNSTGRLPTDTFVDKCVFYAVNLLRSACESDFCCHGLHVPGKGFLSYTIQTFGFGSCSGSILSDLFFDNVVGIYNLFCGAATTLTSWHLLVTYCSLHVARWLRFFEHKPFDTHVVVSFAVLNGISIGLLNLSLGFNSVGFYQVTSLEPPLQPHCLPHFWQMLLLCIWVYLLLHHFGV